MRRAPFFTHPGTAGALYPNTRPMALELLPSAYVAMARSLTARPGRRWAPPGTQRRRQSPQQLAAGLERLASYARRFGRDPAEIETIYRTYRFELTDAPASDDRPPFVGNAEQMASDIRAYEAMGVGNMVLDFLRQTEDLDVMLGRMERFAAEVWPLV